VKPLFGGSVISPKAWEAPRTNGGPNSKVRWQGTVYADYNYLAAIHSKQTLKSLDEFRDCTKTGDISKIN